MDEQKLEYNEFGVPSNPDHYNSSGEPSGCSGLFSVIIGAVVGPILGYFIGAIISLALIMPGGCSADALGGALAGAFIGLFVGVIAAISISNRRKWQMVCKVAGNFMG